MLLRVALVGAATLLVGATAALTLRQPLARLLAPLAARLRARIPLLATAFGLLERAAGETAQLLRGGTRHAIELVLLTTLQWTLRYGILWTVLAVFGQCRPDA